MIKALLNFLSGGTAEQVAQYFNQRLELKHKLALTKLEGETELLRAKYTAAAVAAQSEHSWEMAQLANAGHKDEVVLGVLLVPYLGSFIPGVQDYILIGFNYLDQMPYWAVGLTVTIFLAIYGIRHKNASKISAPGLRDKDVVAKE